MTYTQKKFRIGDQIVDPVHNEISDNGHTYSLEQKAMDVLLYLAEHEGRTVSREELLDAVWADTYVTEESLTRCISMLRKAFDDDAGNPAYIKTIRNKGYQLIARVSETGHPGTEPGFMEIIFRPAWIRVAGVVGVLVLLGLLPTVLVENGDSSATPLLWTKQPLTAQKGMETDPALSPDGSRIAYSARNSETGRWSIYVQVTGAGEPYLLTGAGFDDRAPEWSPDGRFIAFIRQNESGSAIYTTPAMGGSENKLVERNVASFPHLNWSPDGSWLAYNDRTAPDASMTLFRINTRTGEKEQLTQTSAQHWGDFSPSWSPDGRKLSFIASVSAGTQAIFELDVETGQETRITPGFFKTKYQRWSASDSTIYYVTDLPAPHSIWEITGTDPFESRWTGMSGTAFSPGPSRSMAVVQEAGDLDLWSWSPEGEGLTEWASPGVNSTGREYAPVPSPDGSLLAFISDRTGHPELWTYDSRDSTLKQLTRFEGRTDIRSPAWHPSGDRLVFNVFSSGTHADIHTVEISGAPPSPLVSGPSNEVEPAWSPDGKSLLFGSDQTGRWQIWRYSPAEKKSTQITEDGGYSARPAREGDAFYFTKYDRDGIWEYRADGTEAQIISSSQGVSGAMWNVGRSGIYILASRSDSPAAELQFYDFKLKAVRGMAVLNELSVIRGIAASNTGDRIIISGGRDPESGIFLYSRKEQNGFPF